MVIGKVQVKKGEKEEKEEIVGRDENARRKETYGLSKYGLTGGLCRDSEREVE